MVHFTLENILNVLKPLKHSLIPRERFKRLYIFKGVQLLINKIKKYLQVVISI